MNRSFRGQAARTLAVSAMAAFLAMGSLTTAFAETSGGELKAGVTEAAAEEAEKDWLSIGSVVTLKGYDQEFMILGRVIQNASDDKFYDYCACLYPDGYQGGDLYFFNKDDIGNIASSGFVDEYEQMYRKENLEGIDVDELTKRAKEMETAEEETEAASEAAAEQTGEADAESEAAEKETAESEAGESEKAEDESETKAAPAKEGKTYTTTSNVRLRAEASTDSDILATIPADRQVKEDTGRDGKDGWVPVTFTDSAGAELKGFIKKDFLK